MSGEAGRRITRSLVAVTTQGAWLLASLLGALVLLQVLLWAAPGDPISLLPNGEELRPALEKQWGLDLPLPARIARASYSALTGDLGVSLSVRPGAPVAELVAEAGGRSLALLAAALIVAVGGGLILAWVTRRRLWRGLVLAISAVPVFLLAWALVSTLNEGTWALLQRDLITRPGWFALPDQPSMLRTLLAIGALAVGSGSLSELQATFADEIAAVRRAGYVDAIRALGLPVWPVILRNLAPAVVSVAASRVAVLLGGLIVIEKVLLLRGAGALLWEACLQRDYPLAFGLGLAAAAAAAGARFLGDLAVALMDPRPRSGEA